MTSRSKYLSESTNELKWKTWHKTLSNFRHTHTLDGKLQNGLLWQHNPDTPVQDRSVWTTKIYSLLIYLAADKGEQKRYSMVNIIEPYIKLVK